MNLRLLTFQCIVILLCSLCIAKEKDRGVLREISLVNQNIQIEYIAYRDGDIEVIKLNERKVTKAQKRTIRLSLEKALRILRGRPKKLVKEIEASIAVDSEKYEAVLIVGDDEKDTIFLFEKGSRSLREISSLLDFPRKEND